MSEPQTRQIGNVSVTLTQQGDIDMWNVRTVWLDSSGQELTHGSKTFTGDMAWFDATAFANRILVDVWQKKDPTAPSPVFDIP